MEKLNDIFNNIKERLTNPLIFSFVCSWLISNWQITVSLLWFNSKQIENAKYVSIFALIKDKINTTDSLWLPLSFAIGYTLLMPVIRNLIRAFYSWTSKWGDKWNFKILNQGEISINKYLQLRADHEKRSKILEDVISKESSYIENLNSVKTELLEVKNINNEIAQKLATAETFIQQSQNINILNGLWETKYEFEDGQKGTEMIYIEGERYYIVEEFDIKVHVFNITNLYYDNRSGKIFFIKELVTVEKSKRLKTEYFNFNVLQFQGKEKLTGTENALTKIVYTKQQLPH